MSRMFIVFSLMIPLFGCGFFSSPKASSLGEQESGYTYVPIDPFPVEIIPGPSCNKESAVFPDSLLESLPDNAVRMLVERFDASGKVTYGPSNVKATTGAYRVTIDYINADTINTRVWITKRVSRSENKDGKPSFSQMTVSLATSPKSVGYEEGSEEYTVRSQRTVEPDDKSDVMNYGTEVNIPVYVGIGLRVTSNIDVLDSSANIAGLGVIGAEAEANKLKGSLIVQTLGVNGKSVASALPIQSELNRTTAQSAIVAVGSIKALLYAPETLVYPRVVGLYLPFPGGKPLVNALISELSKHRPQWERACKLKDAVTNANEDRPARPSLAPPAPNP